jgi:F0F1-type ATP synthase assembly protein I
MTREVMVGRALACLWIVMVIAYWLWATVTHAGAFRWLADMQVETFGRYFGRSTALIPATLLCAPALVYLGRRDAEARAAAVAELGEEAADERAFHRSNRLWAGFGVAACLVGAGALMLSPRFVGDDRLFLQVVAFLGVFFGIVSLLAAGMVSFRGYVPKGDR